ncbi:MAG: hypothetical protein ACYTKC_18640 [Planctomycetota bacterium]|jgi:hypothetical protein
MQRHSLVYTAALIAVFSFAAPAPAQILPGHSIATVIAGTGTARTGEIYDIDHQTGKATQLRTPAIFNTEWPNTILMANPVSGWVGTNSPGNIYSISVTGGNVTAKKLNTNATAGNNVAQMVLVGSTLYFTTQTAGVIGTLYSMPSGGGAVTQVLDLSKAGGVRLANAVAAIGTTVFVGTFTSSPAPNNVAELIAYDTVKKTGSKHMDIPAGVWQTGWGMGVVSMHQVPIRPRNLALFGVYGDYFEIDVVSKKVVVKEFTGPHLGNGGNNAVNSAAWDPVGQDWIMGTRDGFVDRWVDGQCAEKIIPGVGTATTATQNRLSRIRRRGLLHRQGLCGARGLYRHRCEHGRASARQQQVRPWPLQRCRRRPLPVEHGPAAPDAALRPGGCGGGRVQALRQGGLRAGGRGDRHRQWPGQGRDPSADSHHRAQGDEGLPPVAPWQQGSGERCPVHGVQRPTRRDQVVEIN